VVPDEELSKGVEEAVTAALGKAFRPGIIKWVDDLPRTRSAKIMRRVIKAVALGQEPGDLAGLENPQSLDGL
jgi:acetyl-CoA synthetase